MVICLLRGADLHMVQLMPLPLTVSCFSKIQIGFTFLVPAHPGSPGQSAIKRVCVCVCGSWLHEAMTNCVPHGCGQGNMTHFYILGAMQWRREGVCRPGQTSVLPPPPIRSAIDILMVTTMTLVWSVTNITLSWGGV